MKEALILFVRHPVAGKVKTRLAKDIGDEEALVVYRKLLQHTHDITRDLPYDKFVFYADKIVTSDIWEEEKYCKRVQSGKDLGVRMKNAFQSLFENGYKKIIIIGSDCPALSGETIEQGFKELGAFSVTLGPAVDGGYYLLGLSNMIEELFKDKKWSTDSVLADTIADLEKRQTSYYLLPVLRDIDTNEDLISLNSTRPI